MNSRKNGEKEFHDNLRTGLFDQRWSPELEKVIQSDPMWANMKYYPIERKSRKAVLEWYAQNCKDKKILDYCCGNGDDSIVVLKKGAKEVIGIDISDVSVDNCTKRARNEGYGDNTSFCVMDAEALKFDDNYFDIVTEYGALHHLDLEKAYSEIARVLRPNGSCICTETLGHNPVIHFYRKLTPRLRTEWEVEHILRKKDIEIARKYFNDVRVLGFFHLVTLGAVPFRMSPFFSGVLTVLEILDDMLLRIPGIRWQAWQAVFVLSNPKK